MKGSLKAKLCAGIFTLGLVSTANANLIGTNFFLEDGGVTEFTGELFLDEGLLTPNTFISFATIDDPTSIDATFMGGSLSITVEGTLFGIADIIGTLGLKGVLTDATGLGLTFHENSSGSLIGFGGNGFEQLVVSEGGLQWNYKDPNGVFLHNGDTTSFAPIELTRVQVPEPGTVGLLLIGLVGVAGAGWRRRKQ